MMGLRKASGESKDLKGYYSGHYYQVNYDVHAGEVFADYHYSLVPNCWTQYRDEDIINCGNISSPKTMQEVANIVWKKVQYMKVNCRTVTMKG